MTLARESRSARARALIDAPARCRSMIDARCGAVVQTGRPRFLPWAPAGGMLFTA